MKKRYVLILSLLVLVLSMSLVSAGLFDGLFKENSKGSSGTENMFIDGGTSKNCSTEWLVLKNLTKTVTENGTIITCADESGVYANKPNTTLSWEDTFEWTTPFTVEFDVVEYDGGAHIRINDNTNEATKALSSIGVKNGSHVKIVSSEDSIVFNVDGKQKHTINGKFTDAQIGFRLMNSTVTYKNFKIY